MATLAQDTFSRADASGTWGTASDGKTWARDVGVGVPNIVSQQGRLGPGGNDTHMVLGSGTAATINILCRIKSGDALNAACVLFRYSNAGSVSAYRAGIFGSSLVVDRYVSGARTNIGSTNVGYVTGEEWWVRAIANGTSITVAAWKDGNSEPGSPQLSLTDSSIATGQYGISVFMNADFTYFDSLTITDNQSSVTTITQSITESNPMSETFSLTCLATKSETTTLLEAYALAIGVSSSETILNNEQWTIANAFTFSETTQPSESLVTILQVAPTETITLSEAMSLVLALSKAEVNPVTERIFAGQPLPTAPTHVRVTLTSRRGAISLSSERGTITLTSSRGIISMEGT